MKKKAQKDKFLTDIQEQFKAFEVPASSDIWKKIENELDDVDEDSVKRLKLKEKRRIVDFLKYGSAS